MASACLIDLIKKEESLLPQTSFPESTTGQFPAMTAADLVKVFPCDSLGGAKYLKSLKAPLPQVQMVPTGGVTLQTAADFIKAEASALGVGSHLVDVKALREGQAGLITERARQFVEIVKSSRQ